jgi:hypothetical protein
MTHAEGNRVRSHILVPDVPEVTRIPIPAAHVSTTCPPAKYAQRVRQSEAVLS